MVEQVTSHDRGEGIGEMIDRGCDHVFWVSTFRGTEFKESWVIFICAKKGERLEISEWSTRSPFVCTH